MNNEPNTEPITEVTEAPMETKEALIDTNETDIEPISFSIEDQPKDQSTVEPEQDLLEKPAPIKKQRTEKQIQAFRKAQEALKAKRFLRKQEKESAPTCSFRKSCILYLGEIVGNSHTILKKH